MTICCLGDLVLDVIVRLEQPLATGADATSRIVLRPGGQAANVAAWVAALGGTIALRRQTRRRRRQARSRPRGCAQLGVELVGPVEPDGNGVIVSLVDPPGERTMCSDRGVAAELRPEEVEPAWFARLRPPPRLGLRAPARAGPLRRDAAAIEHARVRGRAGEHRPLVVERDPRLRAERFRAQLERAGARRRLRERGRGRDRRRPARAGRLDPQARRGRRVVRRRRACSRSRSRRSSTRPGQATRSPPAGSSAGRSSRSRPARAASSSPGRCPARGRPV